MALKAKNKGLYKRTLNHHLWGKIDDSIHINYIILDFIQGHQVTQATLQDLTSEIVPSTLVYANCKQRNVRKGVSGEISFF